MSFDANKLRQIILHKLRNVNGELAFDEKGLIFVRATLELAANIKDEVHAQAALQEFVRIMVGLEAGAPAASAQLREAFKTSAAALVRFADLKTRPKRRFLGFTGTKENKAAPSFGAEATGISLKDLLPPGQGRGPARRAPSLPAKRPGQ